jgi:uncharacterized protein Smg (DUF494 family)
MSKENLFDILLYLFESCFSDSGEMPPLLDQKMGGDHLSSEVMASLARLEKIVSQTLKKENLQKQSFIRVFSAQEMEALTLAARNYLVYLERIGVIDENCREAILL